MRVYVPLTLSRLAEAYKAGELGAAAAAGDGAGVGGEGGSLSAYAVTPALREWCGSDDVEELEYAALSQAAAASLRLIAEESGGARRRVVLAADVADGALAEVAEALGEVRVAGVLPFKKVAAVHVDAEDAEADVAAALEGAVRGDAGGGEVGVEDHELLWFATQEIPGLIG
ncbi:hypothetical protein AB0I94_33360 [Streptomyces sp. NPDC050147]|uniref:DUF6912 family protein n=1 Tax=Streptomyces sp. NPDC050147 TaxID=3155513 RepID=UPI00341C5C7C